MPTEINLQLNSCQAKDKPPRPLRSERTRKADGTASSRIACQESTLWQCRQQIQFDVTLFKAHKPLCMHPLSDERSAGEIILPTAFPDLLSVTGKEVKCSLNLRQDNFGRSAAWSGGSAATVWTATVCCSTTEKHTPVCS